MKIDWLYFTLAAVLLWPPIPLKGVRLYSLIHRHDSEGSVGAMFGVWQNWVDLARAAAGSYILTHFVIVSSHSSTLKWIAAFAGFGVLIQTVRRTRGIQLTAPIFYLSGMLLTISDPAIGGFAVFAGWMFTLGAGQISFQIPFTIIGLAGASYVLAGLNLTTIVNCLIAAIPLAAAFVFRLPLLFVARAPSRSLENQSPQRLDRARSDAQDSTRK